MLLSLQVVFLFSPSAGWNDECRKQDDANVGYKVWEETGCPRSKALFNLEIYQAQHKYKSLVHHLQGRKQQCLLLKKLYASYRVDTFWFKIKQLNHSSTSHASVVDEISGS